jgi:hypothetical protein
MRSNCDNEASPCALRAGGPCSVDPGKYWPNGPGLGGAPARHSVMLALPLARSKEIILLSIFPAAYFIFIASFVARNDRTFLPLIPFASLLAASFLAAMMRKAMALRSETLRKGSRLGLACLLIASLSLPLAKTVTDTVQLTTVYGRETARVWITRNLPAGAKIGFESYSPFIDPAQFSILGAWPGPLVGVQM